MAAIMGHADPLAGVPFQEIWLGDFEFRCERGEHPSPVCAVFRELRSGREISLWQAELGRLDRAPFGIGPDTLFVAYAAAAEAACMLQLGWPLPVNILDLFFEHRCDTNGLLLPHGNGLLDALALRGLPHIDHDLKATTRQLIIGQTAWSNDERGTILDYCRTDVDALEALLGAMARNIDWPRALLRGRYAPAVARIERHGIPIDWPVLDRFGRDWHHVRSMLIASVDEAYGVYEQGVFKHDRFARFLADRGIAWPRTPTGRLALDDDTFRRQALLWPVISPLRELRVTLAAMQQASIPVGQDYRARCSVMPFSSITGRNQPRTSEFVFALPKWARGFIRPPEGYGVAHIDFSAQEIGIAAALSGDEAMKDHYHDDPYIGFAKAAGMAPMDATKDTHVAARARAKALFIAVLYGMRAEALAANAGITTAEAAELLRLHRKTYRRFWEWTEETVTTAMLTSSMVTAFGWKRQIGPNPNPRSIANFPLQANGAEMMRIAAIAATEAGIEVCAPIHDAFLIAARCTAWTRTSPTCARS
jgi:hypothetical protein